MGVAGVPGAVSSLEKEEKYWKLNKWIWRGKNIIFKSNLPFGKKGD